MILVRLSPLRGNGTLGDAFVLEFEKNNFGRAGIFGPEFSLALGFLEPWTWRPIGITLRLENVESRFFGVEFAFHGRRISAVVDPGSSLFGGRARLRIFRMVQRARRNHSMKIASPQRGISVVFEFLGPFPMAEGTRLESFTIVQHRSRRHGINVPRLLVRVNDRSAKRQIGEILSLYRLNVRRNFRLGDLDFRRFYDRTFNHRKHEIVHVEIVVFRRRLTPQKREILRIVAPAASFPGHEHRQIRVRPHVLVVPIYILVVGISRVTKFPRRRWRGRRHLRIVQQPARPLQRILRILSSRPFSLWFRRRTPAWFFHRVPRTWAYRRILVSNFRTFERRPRRHAIHFARRVQQLRVHYFRWLKKWFSRWKLFHRKIDLFRPLGMINSLFLIPRVKIKLLIIDFYFVFWCEKSIKFGHFAFLTGRV